MKKQKVYLDTAVIGGCFDDKFKIWSNGLFKDFESGLFLPVISQVTSLEIEKAPLFLKEKYYILLDYNVEVIEITLDVRKLAKLYHKRNILVKTHSDDALYIAAATIAEVDLLVSWNFKHIVHFDKIRQFNAVNLEMGYKTIQIYSPMEVTSYGKEV